MSYENSDGPVAIIVAFVIVIGAIISLGIKFSGVDGEAARPEAETFGKSICGKDFMSSQCADVDTDHDGYVSCTVVCAKEGGGREIHAVECAAKVTFNSGCRMQRAYPASRRLA